MSLLEKITNEAKEKIEKLSKKESYSLLCSLAYHQAKVKGDWDYITVSYDKDNGEVGKIEITRQSIVDFINIVHDYDIN